MNEQQPLTIDELKQLNDRLTRSRNGVVVSRMRAKAARLMSEGPAAVRDFLAEARAADERKKRGQP
jgi:hypothetical protein